MIFSFLVQVRQGMFLGILYM